MYSIENKERKTLEAMWFVSIVTTGLSRGFWFGVGSYIITRHADNLGASAWMLQVVNILLITGGILRPLVKRLPDRYVWTAITAVELMSVGMSILLLKRPILWATLLPFSRGITYALADLVYGDMSQRMGRLTDGTDFKDWENSNNDKNALLTSLSMLISALSFYLMARVNLQASVITSIPISILDAVGYVLYYLACKKYSKSIHG